MSDVDVADETVVANKNSVGDFDETSLCLNVVVTMMFWLIV